MAKNDIKSVADYIASQPSAAQAVLKRVRTAVRKALPDADEGIAYGMPAYKRNGTAVLYFAGWKHHFSLYPASANLLAEFRGDLGSCTVSKGTLRFSLSEPVPAALIERIAKYRAREIAAPERATTRKQNRNR